MSQRSPNMMTENVVFRLPGSHIQRSGRPIGTGSAKGISIIPLSNSRRTYLTLNKLRTVEATCLRSPEQEAQWQRTGRACECSLLYVADNHRSAWASRCISQSTHVVFVADAGCDTLEHDAIALVSKLQLNVSLVLVHDANSCTPTSRPQWLQNFPLAQILHVRSGSQTDLETVVRLVTHRAMCVVFSGGGARALAHVGALLAFEEKGLAIDAVGGTSMGGLVAALVASGRNANEILDGTRRHLVDGNPMRDYTLPFTSLVRGRRLAGLFQEIFGDTTIEKLWKPFFCVSTDLTARSIMVHRSGSLLLALRATTAIPGILPPVTEDGRVLVDGCIVDSLPTRVMRAVQGGQIVGIDASASFAITAADVTAKAQSWFRSRLDRRRSLPPLARILLSSAAVGGCMQSVANRAAADVLIEPKLDGIGVLSFKAFDKAVEAGYRATLEAIPRLDVPHAVDIAPLGRAA